MVKKAKIIIILFLLIMLTGCKQDSIADSTEPEVVTPVVIEEQPKVYVDFGEEFIKTAKKYGYVNETEGPNRSPEIDKFHDYVGLPYGNPWCLMFVDYVQYDALKPYNLKPYTKTARVSRLYQFALKNKYLYKVKFDKALLYGAQKAEVGDILIFVSGASKQAMDNFNGHTGFIIREKSPGKFRTIEGNTGPGSAGSQRDGDGVYERNRSIILGSNFRIEALIEPLYPKTEK